MSGLQSSCIRDLRTVSFRSLKKSNVVAFTKLTALLGEIIAVMSWTEGSRITGVLRVEIDQRLYEQMISYLYNYVALVSASYC